MIGKETIFTFGGTGADANVFALQMAGISYCDNAYHIRRKASSIFVLEYVTHGTGTVRINSREFHPRAGDIYLLHRNMDHDYFSDAKDPWIKIWFNVEGTLTDHLIQAYGLSDIFHVENAGIPLQKLFETGLARASYFNARREKAGVHAEMAITVHRILSTISSGLPKTCHSEPVRRMREFIDHRYDRTVSLPDISREAGRSASQAIRLFKKETGMTPYDYLLNRRVNEAKLLLRDTTLAVKAIAQRLGFCDEYHFSAYFKRKSGVSPLVWRKK